LTELWGIAKTTFGGIQDALMAGDWEMAGDVLWAGLQSAWSTGIGALERMWMDFRVAMVETFAGVVIEVHKMWSGMVQGIAESITGAAMEEGAAGGLARLMLGYDPREMQAERDRMAAELDPVRKRNLEGAIAEKERLLKIMQEQGYAAAAA
jgi:hypothetical protein